MEEKEPLDFAPDENARHAGGKDLTITGGSNADDLNFAFDLKGDSIESLQTSRQGAPGLLHGVVSEGIDINPGEINRTKRAVLARDRFGSGAIRPLLGANPVRYQPHNQERAQCRQTPPPIP